MKPFYRLFSFSYMTKGTVHFSTLFILLISSAQTGKSFIRHDRLLFRSDECQWLVKTGGGGNKLVSQCILESIQTGKLKATDPFSGKMIPPDKIFVWKQDVDTVMGWDERKNENAMKIIQRKIDPASISRIRIFEDWYYDPATGKLRSQMIKTELLKELVSSTGGIIGYIPFCRVE